MMIKLRKILLFIFAFFIVTMTSQNAYCSATKTNVVKKDIEVQTKDARIIKATITYVNIANLKKYPAVLLLHSIGYSSDDWGSLIPELNNAGYAVIAMDLRGHGKSIYTADFKMKDWTFFTNKTFQKYPSDVVALMNQVQNQVKNLDFNNYAIVGADVGANTAILATKDLKKKPKTIVLISATTSFKGLYIPIAMTDVNVPILSMASKKDRYCIAQQRELAKFAQGGFYAQDYPQGGMGMLMIKANPSMSQDIVKWLIKYLH